VKFTKISVLVPTRKRIARLRTMIDSFEATNDGCAELVFRIDDDDVESRDFLAALSYEVIVGPRLLGYTSMPAFFNEMMMVATGDVLMCGNDDMVFRTHNWPSMVLNVANRYPDGLFDIGVSTYNETHYPFYIVSRWAANTLGFLIDPRVYWADIYWRDIMGQFGRCVMVPMVHIDHDWVGHNPDETFVEANQNAIYQRDPQYWEKTHAVAVAEAVARLRAALYEAAVERT
jgi:hypothetical protein